MKIKFLLMILVTLPFLFGFMNFVEDVKSDYTFDKEDMGLVVLSLERIGNKTWPLGWISFEGDGEAYATSLKDIHSRNDFSTDTPFLNEFEGKLVTFELKAGDYKFQSYRNSANTKGSVAIDKSFKVVPGKINYIGNYLIHIKTVGRNASVNFLFRDMAHRDLQLVQIQYPQFKTIQTRLDI